MVAPPALIDLDLGLHAGHGRFFGFCVSRLSVVRGLPDRKALCAECNVKSVKCKVWVRGYFRRWSERGQRWVQSVKCKVWVRGYFRRWSERAGQSAKCEVYTFQSVCGAQGAKSKVQSVKCTLRVGVAACRKPVPLPGRCWPHKAGYTATLLTGHTLHCSRCMHC